MLDLSFQPDRESARPLYRQLQDYLCELIETQRLAPAEQLPATRELAGSLGLSRNTVTQAYQALIDQGLLSAHVGQGTFVTARSPRPPPAGVPGAVPGPSRGFAWSGLLARRCRRLALPAAFQREPGAVPFDFCGGQVDLASLPLADLKRASARALERLPGIASRPDPFGHAPLRDAVARSLVARDIRCRADDVLIVNGAQHGLDLLARALVDPGDCVAMEQPGYFGAAFAFAAAEAHVVGVRVDAEGLRTDELARILRARRVKLLYTTPAVQSPTGVALSDRRRRELLALSDEFQLPLVEDDYDSELRYDAAAAPALARLDDAGRVAYVGTFSKALFAGLRVGYVVAARELLARLALARFAGDFQTDVLTQATLVELLDDGGLERHLRRVRRIYAARRAALLSALAEHMPEGTHWTPPAGGNTVWVALPPACDGERLQAAARQEGIAYTRGDAFFLDGSGRDHLSLSFARLDETRIAEGVERLARLVWHAREGSG